MAHVLFEKGKKIGEVSDWDFKASDAVYKEFLGKTVLATKANKECKFTSPKPIRRGNDFMVVIDGKTKLKLDVTKVVGGTFITAIVREQTET